MTYSLALCADFVKRNCLVMFACNPSEAADETWSHQILQTRLLRQKADGTSKKCGHVCKPNTLDLRGWQATTAESLQCLIKHYIVITLY